jgi:hypothetical protein
VLISGHPEYCPEPVLVAIAGSTWEGSMLKRGFVGRGMHLGFLSRPNFGKSAATYGFRWTSTQGLGRMVRCTTTANYIAE